MCVVYDAQWPSIRVGLVQSEDPGVERIVELGEVGEGESSAGGSVNGERV